MIIKPKLTLCMIVKNEIDCLQRCIDSVRDIVDEIIIVDTGSTDGTLELAKILATRVFQIDWRDDFSYARNISIAEATGDWILVLDADNFLRKESCSALLRALLVPNMLSYQLIIRDHYDGGYSESTPTTRLFRRMPAVRYTGQIHEQITPSLREMVKNDPQWRTAKLDEVIIEHDGYMQTSAKNRNKSSRNIRLLDMALKDDPSNIYLRYKLAQSLGIHSDDGFRHLMRSIEELLNNPVNQIKQMLFAHELMSNAALALTEKNKMQKAIEVAEAAETLFSKHPIVSYAKARALFLSGNHDSALRIAQESIINTKSASDFPFNETWLKEEIYLLLSSVYLAKGEQYLAADILKKAVLEYPRSRRLVYSLIRYALANGMPLLALDTGVKWIKANGLDEECLLLCADASEMHGDTATAQRWRMLACSTDETEALK